MKTIPTTSGTEPMVSPIYAFKISQSGDENSSSNSSMNALLIALEQALDKINLMLCLAQIIFTGFYTNGANRNQWC